MSSSAADVPLQQRQDAVDQEQPPNGAHHHQQQHRPPPQEPPLPVMERVLFQLHQRTCQYGLTYLSGTTRQFLEHCILVIAVGAFGAWLLLHRQFMYSPSHDNAATQCLSSIEGFDPSMDVHRIQILRPPPFRIGDDSAAQISRVILSTTRDNSTSCAVKDDTDHKATTISFSISTTRGFLQLPLNHSLFQDGVLSSQTVVLAPHDDKCFGEPFLQFLIHNLVGYETIVWNWALGQQVIQQQQQQGYIGETPKKVFVWSHAKGRLQELDIPPQPAGLSSQPTKTDESSEVFAFFSFLSLARPRLSLISKLSVVIKTSFLFLFSTTLVSFTLRETQERMLEFTQELSRRVSIQLPLVDLIVFHLIHNLVFVPIMVGMMFFLIEFYSGDRLLAFLVMSIVWCVEVFSVISLRSYQGITFFPRAFFLLFSLFHIYYFANPYGFAYTAIGVVGLFMLHSMAFFWHRYELPAVVSGRVTIDRPRLHYDDHRGGVEDDGVEESASPPPPWVSSSRGTGRSGHSGMNRHEEPLLHPESPPQIRPSPRPLDFAALGGGQYESSSGGRSTRPSQPWSAVPQMPLPRQNSASSRNNSVNSSSYNVYGDGDDEDSSSYVYFMQGEVVLHRNDRQQPHIATASSVSNPAAIFNVESAHTLASTTSAQDLRQYSGFNQQAPPEGGGGSSSHIGLDLTSTDQDALQSNTRAAAATATTDTSTPHPDTIIYSSPPTSNEPRTTNSAEDVPKDSTQPNYSGDDSKGGLQSILEVRLTPRHRNMGRGDQGRTSSPAPIFPNLPP